MIIKAKITSRGGQQKTAYYKHTSNGKPIFCSRADAARFDADTAQKVLAHLKVMDSRFSDAELVES